MNAVEQQGSVTELDITEIMALLPHRYPFLMIERLINIVPNDSATGIKNVSVNEPHFQGHFPDHPIMPGVLIIEAMAQSAACLVAHSVGLEGVKAKSVYFMSVEEARFRKPVVPGDQLLLHVKKQRRRGPVWRFSAEAVVNGVLMAEATYTAMIADS